MASEEADTPQSRLARLLDGYLTTQLLYVAARLGVADVLAGGPRTAAEVAGAVGAEPRALARVLRGLAVDGVLAEGADGRFALTELGECLRDTPGSLHGPALVRGELYFRAAAGLWEALQHGGTAFEQVYGQRFFDHLAGHPEAEAAFQESMAMRAEREAAYVVAAYDFNPIRTLVDVGGGRGILTEAILRATGDLSAVVLDRASVVERTAERLRAAGFAARCRAEAGDFFAAVPPGADAYLLSRVIHDWDDADAVRILANCRAAMTAGSRLLIVDAVLPRYARDRPAAIRMDLHMLVLLGACERTVAEFDGLLSQADLRLRQVYGTDSPDGLGVIEAVR